MHSNSFTHAQVYLLHLLKCFFLLIVEKGDLRKALLKVTSMRVTMSINNSKWPPRISFIIVVDANTQSEIIQIVLSHSPRYGDVQVIFSRFNLNSKWSLRINFILFRGRKN